MKVRARLVLVAIVALLPMLMPAARAEAAVNVITSTEDLAALTREIGGDKVKVEALARGYQDPHFVEPKPSFILKLHSADLLIAVGRDLEIGWLPPLIQQSRNAKIQPGADGYLDASLTVRILEIPTGQITRAMGDVHPLGNPHYWLEPGNGRKIAQAIQQKLSAMDAGDAAYFTQRYADFDKRLADAEKRWDAEMAPYKGLKIVTYHNSWPNFAERFHLNVVGYVEPRPGIPPSPSHTFDLIQAMKRDAIKIIIVEPYFDLKTPNAIARETGAKVVVLAPSVGGADKIATYFDLFDYDIKTLAAAIKETGAAGTGSK
jgi:zinc/manganese transport system substrate-binding protein